MVWQSFKSCMGKMDNAAGKGDIFGIQSDQQDLGFRDIR